MLDSPWVVEGEVSQNVAASRLHTRITLSTMNDVYKKVANCRSEKLATMTFW